MPEGMPGVGEKDVAAAMSGVEAPLAEAPAAPSAAALDQLTGALDFSICAAELSEFQAASRKLQEVSGTGRRLMFMAAARLHRGDFQGARQALDSAHALPRPAEIAGLKVWGNLERRWRLCEAAGVGNFIQAYMGNRALLVFLETGVLTPPFHIMLEGWRVGISNFDDERYVLGIIDAAHELERYAVNRGQELDLQSINLVLGAIQSLEHALMQFDFRNSDLRRRFDGVKYIVKKLETLAYEVDLALKRAAAGSENNSDPILSNAVSTDATDLQASPKKRKLGAVEDTSSTPTAIDLQIIGDIKKRYDRFDAMREQTIKRSRDVTKGAKNAIFALQRDDLDKASALLKQCTRDANSLHKDVVHDNTSLRGGSFAAALEELVEALAYRAFRKERKLLSQEELQQESGLSFPLSLVEYLGGLMDLTGEVGRLAVRSAGRGREGVKDVKVCLACVDKVYSGLQELPLLPGGLGKKMGPLKGTLTKIEGALYELALLSQGGLSVRAPPPSSDTAARADDGTDAKL